MKVCFVSHSAYKAGAERALIETIDVLTQDSVECFVLLPSKGPLINELKKRNIPYNIYPYKWWISSKESSWFIRVASTAINIIMAIPLALRIAQNNCDVIYTNTISIPIGIICAKLIGRPHIWHIHEFVGPNYFLIFNMGTKLSSWIMRKLPSYYIANSYAIANYYSELIPTHNIEVAYQAVNIDKNESHTKLKKSILCNNVDIKCIIVGNINPQKGLEDAIYAVNELIHKKVSIHLYIIGNDSNKKYKIYLQNLIVQYGLENHITFLGYVDNPFPLIQCVDIVLVCSRNEAFGRTTIEAMRASKPVIGSKSGGIIELIRPGFNGFLYEPGNYNELAEKILYLYKNPKISTQMGENGQNWVVSQFTEECYGRKLLSILNRIVDY